MEVINDLTISESNSLDWNESSIQQGIIACVQNTENDIEIYQLRLELLKEEMNQRGNGSNIIMTKLKD